MVTKTITHIRSGLKLPTAPSMPPPQNKTKQNKTLYCLYNMTTISWDSCPGKRLYCSYRNSPKDPPTLPWKVPKHKAGQLYSNPCLILIKPPNWKTHHKSSFQVSTDFAFTPSPFKTLAKLCPGIFSLAKVTQNAALCYPQVVLIIFGKLAFENNNYYLRSTQYVAGSVCAWWTPTHHWILVLTLWSRH